METIVEEEVVSLNNVNVQVNDDYFARADPHSEIKDDWVFVPPPKKTMRPGKANRSRPVMTNQEIDENMKKLIKNLEDHSFNRRRNALKAILLLTAARMNE